jgi:hypothetical protein
LYLEHFALSSTADTYRAAMRLIEQYGDGAEIAAILRADPVVQHDERARDAVRSAITELRGGNRSRPN